MPPENIRRTENVPHDRLTRMAGRLCTALEADPEYEKDDQAILMLRGGEYNGIALHGYDDQTDAMVHLMMHIKAIFESVGKKVDFMFANDDGIFRA